MKEFLKKNLCMVPLKGETIHTGQNCFLWQAENMFISALKVDILTWESMGMDSPVEPASSGH